MEKPLSVLPRRSRSQISPGAGRWEENTGYEKPLGFRSSGRINEKPERRQNVTGPELRQQGVIGTPATQPLHAGRGLRPDRQRGDRPHSQQNNSGRLIMTSDHPGIYTILTDVTQIGFAVMRADIDQGATLPSHQPCNSAGLANRIGE